MRNLATKTGCIIGGTATAVILSAFTAHADIERIETGDWSGQGKVVEMKIVDNTIKSAVQGTVKKAEPRVPDWQPAIQGDDRRSSGFAPPIISNEAARGQWKNVDGKTPINEVIRVGLGWDKDPLERSK